MRCVAWKHFTRGKRKAQALSCCLEREGLGRGKRARMSEREGRSSIVHVDSTSRCQSACGRSVALTRRPYWLRTIWRFFSVYHVAITALQGKYRASCSWQSGVAAWLVVVFADATRAGRYENEFVFLYKCIPLLSLTLLSLCSFSFTVFVTFRLLRCSSRVMCSVWRCFGCVWIIRHVFCSDTAPSCRSKFLT